jgi:hypothetical protein
MVLVPCADPKILYAWHNPCEMGAYGLDFDTTSCIRDSVSFVNGWNASGPLLCGSLHGFLDIDENHLL